MHDYLSWLESSSDFTNYQSLTIKIMLNSKQKGNITELECMLAFVKAGYNVLTPYGDCERYDFVVDIKNKLYKIQVKTSREKDNGDYIEFNTSSQTTKNGKQVHQKYDETQIDYFMTSYKGKTYLVPVNEASTREKRLRFTPPKNGQIKGITFAQEYEFEKAVNKIVNE